MDFWWQKIEWKCSWIHAANWVTQNLRENFATLCPTKHDQLFLALKTDIVTIPPKPEHVVISHPWMNFWKKKKDHWWTSTKPQFCPKKIPRKIRNSKSWRVPMEFQQMRVVYHLWKNHRKRSALGPNLIRPRAQVGGTMGTYVSVIFRGSNP